MAAKDRFNCISERCSLQPIRNQLNITKAMINIIIEHRIVIIYIPPSSQWPGHEVLPLSVPMYVTPMTFTL